MARTNDNRSRRLVVASLLATSTLAASIGRRAAASDAYFAAPYYPTPHTGWVSSWSDSVQKARALVATMTLAEKANITAGTGLEMDLCSGTTGSAHRVGFPQLCLEDSALGVRATDHITVFPAGITTGATWDKSLMQQRGEAMGQEFRGKGINVCLGPTIGPMGRKPRDGRSWEGFGADPVLQAFGAKLTVQGLQGQGVMATLKHLIGNEQEIWRMYTPITAGYSANIDDRTMHELYLWPFAEGVHAGAAAVMGAYNAVNGSAATQNSYLINNLLKDELGFQGFIMSDWMAQQSGVASALSGLDMAMPGDQMVPTLGTSYWMWEMTRAVLNGTMPVDRLDDAATRIVAAWYQTGQDKGYPEPNFSAYSTAATGPLHPFSLTGPSGVINHFVDVRADHATVARQIAQDAITMLKNNDSLLPLSTDTPLFLFGTDQKVNPDGANACADASCNKGTLGQGWGSGTAKYETFDDPLSAIQRHAANVTSYNTDSFPNVATPGPDDVAIVFITSDAGEGIYDVEGNAGDRSSAGLVSWHNGDKLVKDAAAKYSNVVVVVHTVGPIIVEPWIDLDSVKAVLIAHLPGQEAGESLTNVLFGSVSPSGHLPYSIPVSESDYPDSVKLIEFGLTQIQDTYTEGLYIDYRYLNSAGHKPRYAFGHGLSYTNFTFTNATITKKTQLTKLPPPRAPKTGLPNYSNASIPPVSEAYKPADYDRFYVWRYLYPWLSNSDAQAAADVATAVASGKKAAYPYPAGYSNKQTAGPAAGGGLGGNEALWDTAYTVAVTVTNTGARNFSAKAVAQAYVQFPPGNGGFDTPAIQLRDFEKTRELAPGESQAVELSFTRKDLSVWDVVAQNWVVPVPGGAYKFWVGGASDALFLACDASTLRCEEGLKPPV